MVDCAEFYRAFVEAGTDFFAGVPDSLLKDICAYISDHAPNHVITANEGGAVALAVGHHIGTGSVPCVYFQNSGLGNAVNPLVSLADPEVYAAPLVLLVGWRGAPGVEDEPQHRKQGRVTLPLLDVLEVPYQVVEDETGRAAEQVAWAVASAREGQRTIALVARKGTFTRYRLRPSARDLPLTREAALVRILEQLDDQDLVVSTTGMASREVFEYRERAGQGHGRDFLTVGCMGHASQIALGLASARPERRVVCLDGDGAWIMHMGGAATIGSVAPGNFRHIVLNNGAHDSVGGQPTVGLDIDIPGVARACGYSTIGTVASDSDLRARLPSFLEGPGPSFLEVQVRQGAREDLGRPTETPLANKASLMGGLSLSVDAGVWRGEGT